MGNRWMTDDEGFVVFFSGSNNFLYDRNTGERTKLVKRADFFTFQSDADEWARYWGGVVYRATKTVMKTELLGVA